MTVFLWIVVPPAALATVLFNAWLLYEVIRLRRADSDHIINWMHLWNTYGRKEDE